MPARKPITKPAPSAYPTGAADSAKRLESAEAKAASKVDKLDAELEKLEGELKQADGDEIETARISDKIKHAAKSLFDETKRWIELAKQVNSFYKAVDESKREGERVTVAEAQEFFRQYDLSIRLAIESYIIALSQDATRAETPEQFYQSHADNLRTAFVAAIEKAQKDGKVPRWATVA